MLSDSEKLVLQFVAGLPCKNEFQVLYKHGPYSSCNIMCWLLGCGVRGTTLLWSRAKCSGQAAHGSLLRVVEAEPARHNVQPVCLWSRCSAALTSWKYSKLFFLCHWVCSIKWQDSQAAACNLKSGILGCDDTKTNRWCWTWGNKLWQLPYWRQIW